MAACIHSAGTAAAGSARPPRTCERLDSRLFALTTSADPQRLATTSGLEIGSDGVRVTIEIASGTKPLTAHELTVIASYENIIDARVPVTELCPVAAEPGVIAVRVPGRGVPDPGRP